MTISNKLLIGAAALAVSVPALADVTGLDWTSAQPPGVVPRFVTHHFVALPDLVELSKFRSSVGHAYSDEYEAPDRSMKHYLVPPPSYRDGNATSLRVYAPVTGRVVTVRQEESQLPDGSFQGFQIHIVPDGYPAFEVRPFHVNPAPDVVVGAHVEGGQPLGYADMRGAQNTDMAVEGIVLGAPAYPSPMRPPGFFPDRGIKYFSMFDVMTDALFADYAARGVDTRGAFIIDKAFRDANPGVFGPPPAPDQFVVLGPSLAPQVVEFLHAGLDHYFITASAAEIADLDSGVHPGWARTGQSFASLPPGAASGSAVCRLYIPPAQGDSHFYSASPQECADSITKFPSLVAEAANVFYVRLPDAITGACAAGFVAVYRLWNQRADSNHRYTTSRALRDQMLARGYVAEGYGPDAVIMCVPAA
jgi:Repeat of unknown function (DUF5648)